MGAHHGAHAPEAPGLTVTGGCHPLPSLFSLSYQRVGGVEGVAWVRQNCVCCCVMVQNVMFHLCLPQRIGGDDDDLDCISHGDVQSMDGVAVTAEDIARTSGGEDSCARFRNVCRPAYVICVSSVSFSRLRARGGKTRHAKNSYP